MFPFLFYCAVSFARIGCNIVHHLSYLRYSGVLGVAVVYQHLNVAVPAPALEHVPGRLRYARVVSREVQFPAVAVVLFYFVVLLVVEAGGVALSPRLLGSESGFACSLLSVVGVGGGYLC